MEYFLAIIDLFDALENEEARPKDTSNLEYKKMNKKNAITYIKKWIDTTSLHHMENETNAYNL